MTCPCVIPFQDSVIHFRDTGLSQPFWFYIITHLSSFSSNFPSPLVSHYLYFTTFTIFIGSYSTSTAHFALVTSGVVDLPHYCSRTKTCSMNENDTSQSNSDTSQSNSDTSQSNSHVDGIVCVHAPPNL